MAAVGCSILKEILKELTLYRRLCSLGLFIFCHQVLMARFYLSTMIRGGHGIMEHSSGILVVLEDRKIVKYIPS